MRFRQFIFFCTRKPVHDEGSLHRQAYTHRRLFSLHLAPLNSLSFRSPTFFSEAKMLKLLRSY